MTLVKPSVPSDVGADAIWAQNHGGPGSLPIVEATVANATGGTRAAAAYLWRQHSHWYSGHPTRKAASLSSRRRRETAIG